MTSKQVSELREKVLVSHDKIYNTRVYQYWINGNEKLVRARQEELNTIECKIEVLD